MMRTRSAGRRLRFDLAHRPSTPENLFRSPFDEQLVYRLVELHFLEKRPFVVKLTTWFSARLM